MLFGSVYKRDSHFKEMSRMSTAGLPSGRLPSGRLPSSGLPLEVIEKILLYLPAKFRFEVATSCGLNWVQNSAIRDSVDDWASLNVASMRGNIELLCKLSKITDIHKLQYTPRAIDDASANNHIAVLNWWMQSGLELKYTTYAMNMASANGHTDVLDFWVKSGLPMKYTSKSMDMASRSNTYGPKVLQWFLDSGLTLRYTKLAIDDASKHGAIECLKWWTSSSGLQLRYSNQAIECASAAGCIDVLEFWKNSGLKLKYGVRAMNSATQVPQIEVLEWWKQSGLQLKYSIAAMDRMTSDSLAGLQWFVDSGLELKFSHVSIDFACLYGRIDILDFWLKLKAQRPELVLRYSPEICTTHVVRSNIRVLDWWSKSGLPFVRELL